MLDDKILQLLHCHLHIVKNVVIRNSENLESIGFQFLLSVLVVFLGGVVDPAINFYDKP